MHKIYGLNYSNTNTWLIEGEKGKLLFDTGWAGRFRCFVKGWDSMVFRCRRSIIS